MLAGRPVSPKTVGDLVKKLERFQALPKDEQIYRRTHAAEISARITRLNRWFTGLPPTTFFLLTSQFFLDGRMYVLASITSWVLLLVLGGFILVRGRLISRMARYIDPDFPMPRG